MKFYPADINLIFKKIQDNEIKSLLIYGPNTGYKTIILQQLTKKFNFLVSNLPNKEIKSINQLQMIANNQNFFGQRELIKITDIASSINKDMKDLLSNNNFTAMLCFISEESLPPSGIRKFFEDSKNAASIACYYDNATNIIKYILQKITKEHKTISEDAITYLKTHLKGDHNIVKNEVEKLLNYTHNQKEITLNDVQAVISSDIMANGDEMCIYFAHKQPDKFLEEIEKLKNQNINEILIIRALIRYHLNLYMVRMKVDHGDSIDLAIRSLYPPIFFKYVSDFKKSFASMNMQQILHNLTILQKAEIEFKLHSKNFNIFQNIYLAAHENKILY